MALRLKGQILHTIMLEYSDYWMTQHVHLQKLRNIGFKDAFIVSFVDNKPISAERAKILEKEWGTKPLYNVIEEETEKYYHNGQGYNSIFFIIQG